MFTRYLSSNRKILTVSILAGLFIALLLGTLQFFWSYHKREVKFDTLIADLSVYMETYFDELKTSIDTLQPLTLNNCHDVSAELTSRAAFSINVRAFLLVRDKRHSALRNRAMNVPWKSLFPNFTSINPLIWRCCQAHPMLPNKPAIAIWYRNPLVKNGVSLLPSIST
jgi:hypothetical protein